MARSTVQECLRRARAAGLSWPLPDELDEAELEARLYPRQAARSSAIAAAGLCAPARELARPRRDASCCCGRSTRPQHPEAGSTACSAISYRRWLSTPELVLRQEHRAGEKLLRRLRRPDGADHRSAHRRDPRGADLRRRARLLELHLRRGHLDAGAARLARRHVRALEFFGGVPRAIVPDNLKSGVQARASLRAGAQPAPTRTSPSTTAWRSCRRGCASRATRPRSRPACWWSSAGSWRGCATAVLLARRAQRRDRRAARASSTTGRSRSSTARVARASSSSIARRCDRCRRAPTSSAQWKMRQGASRLSHRGRARVLLGALRADRRSASRCASRARMVRDLPSAASSSPRMRAPGARSRAAPVDAHRPERHRRGHRSHARAPARARRRDRAGHRRRCCAEQFASQAPPRRDAAQSRRASCASPRTSAPPQLERACERALALKAYSYRAVRTLIATPEPPNPTSPQLIPRARERARARVLPLNPPTETLRC